MVLYVGIVGKTLFPAPRGSRQARKHPEPLRFRHSYPPELPQNRVVKSLPGT